MRRYIDRMLRGTAEHAFKEWKSQTEFLSISKAEAFAIQESNEEIDVIQQANEGLRVKVERVKVQLEQQEHRMEDFQKTAREIVKGEEDSAKRTMQRIRLRAFWSLLIEKAYRNTFHSLEGHG